MERQEGREDEDTGKGERQEQKKKITDTKRYLKTNIISTIIVTRFKMAQFKVHNEVYFNCEKYRF